MTAGQFLNLPILHEKFGKVRIRETGVRLRDVGFFEKGWTTIEPLAAATFLFALFATDSPKHAILAIENAHPDAIKRIADALKDKTFRNTIDEIHINQKNGFTRIHYKNRKDSEDLFLGSSVDLDYNGSRTYPDEVIFSTNIKRLFLANVAKEMGLQ